MRPQKPDRWERIVEDLEFIRDCGGKDIFVCESAAVLKLLRKEHAWVRRMIKAQYKHGVSPGSVNFGYNQAVEFFLDQLKRRAQ